LVGDGGNGLAASGYVGASSTLVLSVGCGSAVTARAVHVFGVRGVATALVGDWDFAASGSVGASHGSTLVHGCLSRALHILGGVCVTRTLTSDGFNGRIIPQAVSTCHFRIINGIFGARCYTQLQRGKGGGCLEEHQLAKTSHVQSHVWMGGGIILRGGSIDGIKERTRVPGVRGQRRKEPFESAWECGKRNFVENWWYGWYVRVWSTARVPERIDSVQKPVRITEFDSFVSRDQLHNKWGRGEGG
jgi:hypothetical protein